ncbi:ribonuclease H-like domain-containing protein [Tanacetum coccineum]
MLKTGDYDIWSIRMEQYLTHTDYALWEVTMNGDAPAVVSASTEGLIPSKTVKQKIARKNELKAKSTLLLAIPDEHLLKFHRIMDAKSLWEAIKTRFRGNKESKKMFQKLISQLEIQGEVISQEDANLKLLRSLPPTWNNIALIMRNKPDLDELCMDDLYNNLKVYEAEIKSQSNSNSHNVAFVSSENTSSTNEAVNIALDVSTASTQGQASSSTYVDDVMFSFFVNQSKSLLLDNEDMEQIDSDDLEEMDLKWQVAMLTMRIKRFIKKTRRNLNLKGKEAVSLDMAKVECYNCHRIGHFARDCRAPRNQGNRNGDNARRVVPVETSANSLVVQDGICSSSSSSSDSEVSTCSKACLKSYESLKEHFDKQKEQLKKSNLEIIGYQLGLESLEARIVVHEKNEASYEESIASLKYDIQVKDISIKNLKNQLEEALKEKDDLKVKLENFKESSKNLTKVINSQISVKDKTGLGFDSHVNESEVLDNVVDSHKYNQVNDRFKKSEGYHAVPPPFIGNFKPARADLSFYRLDDFVYKSKVSETITSVPNVEKPKTVRFSAPIIEDWESDSEDENLFEPKEVKKTVKSSFEKIEFVNARNSTVENPRKFSQNPRDNKRNRNNFEWDFAPIAVLTKSGIVPNSAAGQSSSRAAAPASASRPINTAAPKPFVNVARPRPNAFHKSHSPSRIPFNQQTALKNRNLNDKVNTAKVNSVNTAKGNKVTSVVGEQGINAVKSSACWIWRPKGNVIDHISKDSGSYMPKRFDYGNPQYALQDQGIFDSGCSRHMTGNKFYLSDYQDIDGGFVAFGGSSKGGKITGKGKIRTGKLDFEDVYFVKELKFNLFSVSQMCDKKNSVLFTETECLVLSPDFKLLDESQVLLKIPRQNNMYSFDLKNVVPSGDLTCLFAKATIDESNLWHRRLGHINFKTMNKLVRGNLVRGLPSKLFENDHTCVACQKGKQHKASCSSCGALYNKDHCCSVDTFVRDPNKTPDSSKQSLPNCPNCGDPVDGLVCRPCAFVRKYLNEVCFTSCDENESFKNLLNPPQQTQTHSSESSNDNTNFVDTPQEPFVFNQDPGENSSQSPPHIDHHCCYGCGDSLNEPSQYRKILICYDDDNDEYSFATQEYLKKFSSAITPDLPKSVSLIMEDKHLDTILETESDELINSSVEDLVHTLSETNGISESECDLPICDDSSPKKDKVLDDIISILPGNGNDHFNAESSLIESVLNRDNVISSPKIDFLLEEFTDELALIALIPPGIIEADFDPKGDIRFIENLMYDNSFPRPQETLKDDSKTVIDSNNDYSSSDDDSPK